MLTYCTNVHPGETWAETLANVRHYVPRVKKAVSPGAPFPIGLRLSAQAAGEVTPRAAAGFLDWCLEQNCQVVTINGFPYGSFHASRVKEHAYLPDWRERRRVEYTRQLVGLMRRWLPAGGTGSISTLPIGYRDNIEEEHLPLIRENLCLVLEDLAKVSLQGRRIILALEPEPGCLLQRAEDVIAFVECMRFPPELLPYLGVCFDCSHAAILFENPRRAFTLLAAAGIPVAKIHVSSAVRLTADHRQAVWLFLDPRYLHQTCIRNGMEITSFPDLPELLPREPKGEEEWRIHYHLPIFDDGAGLYGTTNNYIREVLACRPPEALLEIETYTYNVLPAAIRPENVVAGICREFNWLRSCL